MSRKLMLDEAPIETIAEVCRRNGWPVPEKPIVTAQIPANETMQNMPTPRAAVPENARAEIDGPHDAYVVAWMDVQGDIHETLTLAAKMMYERMCDRAIERTGVAPGQDERKLMKQGAATEIVKKWGTTKMVEDAIGKWKAAVRDTEVDEPDDYKEAVEREKAEIDVKLENGDTFQVKAQAGNYDGEHEYIIQQNFEKYWNKQSIEVREG